MSLEMAEMQLHMQQEVDQLGKTLMQEELGYFLEGMLEQGDSPVKNLASYLEDCETEELAFDLSCIRGFKQSDAPEAEKVALLESKGGRYFAETGIRPMEWLSLVEEELGKALARKQHH
ncbi:hypothetical protein GCM10011571_07220 [Marinithermofilum abyssi]|uniref:CdiI immunity protein domain-containing protein n=1 Tax=Marinithermofilum abyssi TaxID=1571185 RepID=A0A8J2YDB0_9BACL|nr:hypothetical protein [Marinithermofilum abyssi]GGE08470.1 hypothetical protein GCM10011571_07220 [Marinithermofilum abyssi]